MFIPKPFKMTNNAQAQQFIRDFGFGVVVSNHNNLTATHLPFVLRSNEGEKGVLYAHCAKANPHWKNLQDTEVLVIFSGPHSYISPSWYTSKPAVPTWNYTAVHATGTATLLGSEETLTAVNAVVEQYEPQLLVNGDIVTEQIKHKMLAGIVGFKIEITQLEGQLKLGQNRSAEDQQSILNALATSSHIADISLANYMQKTNDY
jgi:transcriptional regulator